MILEDSDSWGGLSWGLGICTLDGFAVGAWGHPREVQHLFAVPAHWGDTHLLAFSGFPLCAQHVAGTGQTRMPLPPLQGRPWGQKEQAPSGRLLRRLMSWGVRRQQAGPWAAGVLGVEGGSLEEGAGSMWGRSFS